MVRPRRRNDEFDVALGPEIDRSGRLNQRFLLRAQNRQVASCACTATGATHTLKKLETFRGESISIIRSRLPTSIPDSKTLRRNDHTVFAGHECFLGWWHIGTEGTVRHKSRNPNREVRSKLFGL